MVEHSNFHASDPYTILEHYRKTILPPLSEYCHRQKRIVKNGHRPHQDGSQLQNYRCKACGKQFNERIGTPMYRL